MFVNDVMCALLCRRHTSLGVADIISEASSFARQGKHHSQKNDNGLKKKRVFVNPLQTLELAREAKLDVRCF